MAFEVGRVCVKIAGRDARKRCVVVEVLDSRYVTIDGETRRRKCNISHLEPTDMVLGITSGADNAAVCSALKAEGIVCEPKKESSKQPKPRPTKQKKVKAKKQKKAPAKAPKKETPKKAEAKPAPKTEKKADKPAAKKE